MTFKVIRGQGQGEEMTSVPIGTFFWSAVPHFVNGGGVNLLNGFGFTGKGLSVVF